MELSKACTITVALSYSALGAANAGAWQPFIPRSPPDLNNSAYVDRGFKHDKSPNPNLQQSQVNHLRSTSLDTVNDTMSDDLFPDPHGDFDLSKAAEQLSKNDESSCKLAERLLKVRVISSIDSCIMSR
jgi:hypothetical protein